MAFLRSLQRTFFHSEMPVRYQCLISRIFKESTVAESVLFCRQARMVLTKSEKFSTAKSPPLREEEIYGKSQYGKKKKKMSKQRSRHNIPVQQLTCDLLEDGNNKIFNDMLAAYISVCITTGLDNSAYEAFIYYINENDAFGDSVPRFSVEVFNELLKGIAVTGDYNKMKEVVFNLIRLKVEPTANTFAYILSCCGRYIPPEESPPEEATKATGTLPVLLEKLVAFAQPFLRDGEKHSKELEDEIENTLKWMKEKNINLGDVLTSSMFPSDSLQYCLKAVETKIPNVRKHFVLSKMIQDYAYDGSNPLVKNLNESLFTNKGNSPAEGVLTIEELTKLSQEQMERERKGYVEIPNILQQMESTSHNEDSYEMWESTCAQKLLKKVSNQRTTLKQLFLDREKHDVDLYPIFAALDDQEIVDLLLAEIHNFCSFGKCLPRNTILLGLSKKFYERFVLKYQEKQKHFDSFRDLYEKYCNWYLSPSNADSSCVNRVAWNKLLLEGLVPSSVDQPAPWPNKMHVKLGKLLFHILMTAEITCKREDGEMETFPAFREMFQTDQHIVSAKIVKLTSSLRRDYLGDERQSFTFPANALPMIAVPVPWTSIESGGYLCSKTDFVRWTDCGQYVQNRLKVHSKRSLYPVMDAVNQLAAVPWKINNSILDLILKVFLDDGCSEINICSRYYEGIRPERSKMDPDDDSRGKSEEFREYFRKKKESRNQWGEMLNRLSIANFYRDRVMWFPHNVDFRGRCYPIPPHLTHTLDDVYRSLLVFAQGRKLGKDGLFWLKLNVVNLFGIKKRCSLQERIDYCEDILDEIFDSADNPLEGNLWWTRGDNQWQTLAACKELANAMRSDDPESFVSHLPIGQDGSSNVLQHYFSLSRDPLGAEFVNLAPSTAPKDVYMKIATLVEEQRQKDAEATTPAAKLLEGCIDRKIVKRIVIKSLYGAGRNGTEIEILHNFNVLESLRGDERMTAVPYLVENTFDILRETFPSTKEIKQWLKNVAAAVSKYCGQHVEWITPLGFVVLQPYTGHVIPTVDDPSDIDTPLKMTRGPDSRKQTKSISPNFIHSLEASHMMLTSIYCQQAGVSFASIHDSFWTHASDVPIMNKICRERFVALHSQPILGNMAKVMNKKYGYNKNFRYVSAVDAELWNAKSLHNLISDVPKQGDFDLRRVLESDYFFS